MLKLGLVKPNSSRVRTLCRPARRKVACVPWKRFLKTLKDPEFVAEAKKTRMTLNPIPGTTRTR
jgi:hypothetical protein